MAHPPPPSRPAEHVIALVLGSASPRRRELLEAQGIRLHVRPADVDETAREKETPTAYLDRVVAAKLAKVQADLPAGTRAHAVLVADTTVTIDGEILGKPVDHADAARMLARLSGKTHQVMTRFAIALVEADKTHAETVTTDVTFRPLSAHDIETYVATGECDDKAGAYAVQGKGAAIVKSVAGSYTSVVGLPVCETMIALKALGLAP